MPAVDSDERDVLSVSQLNRQAKSLLESHFDFVWVSGELSSLATPGSGHWYFTLKDSKAQVRCAMFRNRNQRLRFTPEQGDEVRIRCRVSLYEGRGDFQLIVEHMELSGEGALQAAFEKLKAKLQLEGLFDAEAKKPIPDEVRTLGVITSPTGAAIHDILSVLERRCPATRVYVFPVQVQGEDAAGQIAQAIDRANRFHQHADIQLDALIVGRGGGSLEDLWAFNEEIVARAIHASAIPIVSAVGHEVDFSIADFVADLRAPTPSAAAELLSTDQEEQYQQLLGFEYSLIQSVSVKLATLQATAKHLSQRLRHPGSLLREQAQRNDDLAQRLQLAMSNKLARAKGELRWFGSRLNAQSPAPKLQRLQLQRQALNSRLRVAMSQKNRNARAQLQQLVGVMESLSPLATLSRGYAIISDSDGTIVQSARQLEPGDEVEAKLAQGSLGLKVLRRN